MAHQARIQPVPSSTDDPDGQLILERIVELPVSRTGANFGPTPRDFHSAFGLGDANRIDPLDGIGVLMMAVKALRGDVDDLSAEVRATGR